MKTTTILITSFLLFSCNSSQKFVKADYEVHKNETFEVTLNSNPSTGYSWRLAKNNESRKIDSIEVRYAEPNHTMPGASRNEIWKFKGVEKGIDTLTFEYLRSWEPNSTVEIKKIIVKIN